MNQDSGFDIWCGLDVGKQAHHACALDAAGKRVFDKPLPQDQKRLEELFDKLQSHGRVLVVVDQPNTIGALPIAVARNRLITQLRAPAERANAIGKHFKALQKVTLDPGTSPRSLGQPS